MPASYYGRPQNTYQHEKNTYQHEKNTYQHVDQRSGLETPGRCKKTQVGTQKNTGRGKMPGGGGL